MAFAKLDVAILNSTLWIDRDARDLFITALLMAAPQDYPEPVPQIAVRSLDETGWKAPAGWYGFVPAAGVGIIRASGCPLEEGYKGLERLGSPEPDSRSQEFEGRRMIRVDGGFMVLNYMKYRDRDHSAADRMRRLRARKKAKRDGVTPSRDGEQGEDSVTSIRNVTHSRVQRHTTDLLPTYSSSVGRESVQAPADPLEGDTQRDAVTPADPLFLRAHDAEKAIRMSTDALRTKLYGLVSQMVEDDPEHGDPTELMRLVTAYDRPDGKRVPGVVNAATLSHERLENSIADAEALLAEWRKADGSK